MAGSESKDGIVTTSPMPAPLEVRNANKTTATRFIHAFNDDDWATVREVVAPDFVFHHPVGGSVEAGPEGMASTWAGFKVLSPDSWHPIPIMIAEGDYVAVLLPTYGTFTGRAEHGPPPTGGRLDYGMVNMVRFDQGRLAEMWFGMDPLVEMQQLGLAPEAPERPVSTAAAANLERFRGYIGDDWDELDNVVGFDNVVVAMGPPQSERSTSRRRVEVYRFGGTAPSRVYEHEIVTDPPYEGDPATSSDTSRDVVERWIDSVFNGRDTAALEAFVAPHLLIHPTAMPCEAGRYGLPGANEWLSEQRSAFADLAVTDHFSVAERDIVAVRWTARGVSIGELMGQPPTGAPVEFTGVSLYRIEDGKIAEIWDTRNTRGILHQLNPELGAEGHHH